jgi:hypothetical protein
LQNNEAISPEIQPEITKKFPFTPIKEKVNEEEKNANL